MDCPEISDLASLVEGHDLPAETHSHVSGCDACQEALEALQEEIHSLQIPLSEIWFREHISCPHTEVLLAYRGGTLEDDAREYVTFHIEELGCPHCQSRMEQGDLQRSEEGRRSVSRSRERVGEATSALLDQLGHEPK